MGIFGIQLLEGVSSVEIQGITEKKKRKEKGDDKKNTYDQDKRNPICTLA